jgi:DNA-binding LacI/PurR family transcriptional regulator
LKRGKEPQKLANKLEPDDPMMASQPRATLKDVARLSGLSAATVSRVFTPGASISSGARQRVLKISAELGYRPNLMARAVITGRSRVIGLILFSGTNLAYPETLLALSKSFSLKDMRVMLFTVEQHDDLSDIVDQVLSYQLDGVVAAAPIGERHMHAFQRNKVPIIFYNRPAEDFVTSSVSCDHWGCGQLIANRVADEGHTKVAVIESHGSIVGEQRVAGVLTTLNKRGVHVVARADGDFTYEGGAAAVRGWFKKTHFAATAIIAANDMMALGAMDVLTHEIDVAVPRDISVVGFDGTHASGWLSYSLTTVSQPIERMASAVASLMAERMINPVDGQERRLYPGRLLEGSSLAPPKAGEVPRR